MLDKKEFFQSGKGIYISFIQKRFKNWIIIIILNLTNIIINDFYIVDIYWQVKLIGNNES